MKIIGAILSTVLLSQAAVAFVSPVRQKGDVACRIRAPYSGGTSDILTLKPTQDIGTVYQVNMAEAKGIKLEYSPSNQRMVILNHNVISTETQYNTRDNSAAPVTDQAVYFIYENGHFFSEIDCQITR